MITMHHPAPLKAARTRGRGFTLIELMIVVAVTAILAAIAYPSYGAYVTRSKIMEAKSSLNDMRTRMEQYFQDKRQFPAACIPADASGPAPAGSIYLPAALKYFSVTCTFADPASYLVTATGAAAGMTGFAFTIDQANNRVTVGVPAGWSGAGTPCWVMKQDGSC